MAKFPNRFSSRDGHLFTIFSFFALFTLDSCFHFPLFGSFLLPTVHTPLYIFLSSELFLAVKQLSTTKASLLEYVRFHSISLFLSPCAVCVVVLCFSFLEYPCIFDIFVLFCFACVLLFFWYPERCHFACLTHAFVTILVFGLPLSHSL